MKFIQLSRLEKYKVFMQGGCLSNNTNCERMLVVYFSIWDSGSNLWSRAVRMGE